MLRMDVEGRDEGGRSAIFSIFCMQNMQRRQLLSHWMHNAHLTRWSGPT